MRSRRECNPPRLPTAAVRLLPWNDLAPIRLSQCGAARGVPKDPTRRELFRHRRVPPRKRGALCNGDELRALTVAPGFAASARLEDVPEPTISDGTVLVRTVALGGCGTDRDIM